MQYIPVVCICNLKKKVRWNKKYFKWTNWI